MKMTRVSAMAAVVLLATAVTGFAGEPQGWKVEMTPYLWGAGLEGDLTVNGETADFEKSVSDLFKAVEVGGSLFAVVQYDRLLFWGQVDYFSLSTDKMDVEDQPKGGTLDSKMMLGEAAVGYQIDGWMEGQTFDLLLGMRGLSMENDLKVIGRGTASDDRELIDPMLVIRPSIPMLPSKIEGLRFNVTLAIGGGGDSDLVYELFPEVQYQLNDRFAARVGYRAIGYQFKGEDNEENELNIRLAGLIIGLGLTF